MSNLLNKIEEKTTETYTENGAKTFSTTLDANLDFFFQGGALRNQSEKFIVNLFQKAFLEDKNIALANLYHLRDIRGGKGERRASSIIFKWIADFYPEDINLEKMAEYGYYKDILYLLDTQLEDKVILFIKEQLNKDEDSENPSLLAKWLPTWSTKDIDLSRYAKIIVSKLFSCSKQYRKKLKFIRNKLNLVETKLTLNKFEDIDYSKLPSKALNKYKKCFARKDNERFTQFLKDVKEGKGKINTSTLYPYDIARQYCMCYTYGGYCITKPDNEDYLETAWKNLNNIFQSRKNNALVVADTSASMMGQPMWVCLSLAVYIAERNKGLFHNSFIKFSRTPKVIKLQGNSLLSKLQSVACDDFCENTNLQAVFDVILDVAVANKIPQADMPTSLIIVSDMEFDRVCDNADISNFEAAKDKYRKSGYEMPKVVFWNVNARNNNCPVRYNERGVALISGYSPNSLKEILDENFQNPVDVMVKTLSRYMN